MGRMTLLGAGAPAAGAAYDPSQDSPIIWLDSRAGKGVNFTSTTVNTWVNQGSLGGTLTPGVATAGSYIASAQNSLPGVRTISNSYFQSGNVAAGTYSTLVILVIAKLNATPANNRVVFGVGSGGFTSGWGVAFPGNSPGSYVPGDVYGFGNGINSGGQVPPALNAPSGGATTDGAYHVYSVIISTTSGNQQIAIDGTVIGLSTNTSGASLSAVTQAINLGVLPGSENYDLTALQVVAVANPSSPSTTASNLTTWGRGLYGI